MAQGMEGWGVLEVSARVSPTPGSPLQEQCPAMAWAQEGHPGSQVQESKKRGRFLQRPSMG